VRFIGTSPILTKKNFRTNPEMLESFANLPPSISPRLMVLVIGPVVGAIFGVIAGLFAFVGAKIVKRAEAST